MPAPLRRGGIAGLVLLVLTAAVAAAIGAHGLVAVLLATAAGIALCVATHGFGTAPGWALRPIFATFLGGLSLPLVLLLLNA